MKRNLIKGIVLISAIALSSCSSTSKLAGIKNSVNDDDVYYAKAKAGDAVNDMTYASQQNSNTNYNGDDDYYYYGDYASRLSRFSSYSPFDYQDNFYYAYVPYNNGFGAGLDYDRDYYANYYGFGSSASANTYAPVNNGIYSPYNYGYSPYDMGYDDYNYGDAYSAYILGGYGGGGGGGYSYGYGALANKHNTATTVTNIGTNPLARGIRTTSSPGVTRITSMPGRPSVSVNTTTGVVTRNLNLSGNNNNNTASRQTRESYTPQQQSVAPRPSVNTSSNSGSSASSSSTSSGGGGRPVRP